MILDRIEKANDIKNIPREQYDELAMEIRQVIIENVGRNGGHLSSSLGVVELTMALHLSLDLPQDKILWDVGHQAYAHKILSGRKEEFKTLRQYGGISGFPTPAESENDAFGMGHASTSVSAALGMAKARELSGTNETIVAVIGDGALTGGMAYEALNNCGQLHSNLIIILNDNEMSISRNVGGISKLLNTMRTGDHYIDLKDNVKSHLSRIPGYGDELIGKIHDTKNSLKQFLVPGAVFEEMGITYLGPVDGHDIAKLGRMIHAAKRINHAVLIHIHTTKGKGYSYAERRPSYYHGVAPFDIKTGELMDREHPRTYPEVLSSTLCKLAERDPKIVAVTVAMTDNTGLGRFSKKFPERFVDVGIAEEHAVTYAAGMAANGYKPYVVIYSTFMQRAFDQIIHDVCIQELPVRMIVENAGIVGKDGITHQGIFDLSYCGMIPKLTIMAPKNRHEFKEMLDFTADITGPVVIRVPKTPASMCYQNEAVPIEYGRGEILKKGKEVALLAFGSMVETAALVEEQLSLFGVKATVVNLRFAKPLDTKLIDKMAASHKLLVTMEENVLTGGLGSTILQYLNERRASCEVMNIALPDSFIGHGSIEELKRDAGLDPQTITAGIMKRLQ